MEVGEREEGSGDWAGEFVVRDVDCDELGEFGNEWGESSDVTGAIEGELGDSVAGAGEAAEEVVDVMVGARIRGEIPGG